MSLELVLAFLTITTIVLAITATPTSLFLTAFLVFCMVVK